MTDMKTALGIELGSTRIKAVAINENHVPVSSGDYTWKSSYENGVWTYSLDEVWKGLKAAVSGVENRESIKAMGVSAMMTPDTVALVMLMPQLSHRKYNTGWISPSKNRGADCFQGIRNRSQPSFFFTFAHSATPLMHKNARQNRYISIT